MSSETALSRSYRARWPCAAGRARAPLRGSCLRGPECAHDPPAENLLATRIARPGPRADPPPAAREGPHGRGLPRGLARAAPGGGERRVRGPLRALLQAGLRRPAASLPALAAHRARDG